MGFHRIGVTLLASEAATGGSIARLRWPLCGLRCHWLDRCLVRVGRWLQSALTPLGGVPARLTVVTAPATTGNHARLQGSDLLVLHESDQLTEPRKR